MSENMDNEKKNTDAENRETKPEEHSVKSESAASGSDPAQTQETGASAEKTEQPKQEKPAGETAAQPVRPAKKKGGHRKVWQIVGICALCFVCGFGGGVAANYTGLGSSRKETASSDREELEKIFGQMPSQFGNGSQGTQDGDQDDDSANPFAASAALGITVQQVQASDDQAGGVYVKAIADESNAADAGVKVGDRIIKADNTEVTSVSTLAQYIAGKDVGDTVTLTLKRDDQEVTADVTLISKNSVSSSDNEKA